MNPIRTRQSNAGQFVAILSLTLGCLIQTTGAQAATLANAPLFVKASQPPLVLLTMARDHKLYYEAYNDYSDLNGDGSLDVGYKPGIIEYYGQFDSYKCYSYSGGIFIPVAMSDALGTTPETYNKKCTVSGNYWSGDFLNYVTTSRIDALRKVLYGGFRSTDTTTQTILERSFIPQDAHSWGKEYLSVANDGYDISEYTPLALPETDKRHLFANVTLTGYGQPPLMRVLSNSSFRIWNWVSIERPVAGTECATGNNTRSNCTSGSTYSGSPNNAAEYDALVTTYATSGHLQGFRDVANIDQIGTDINPYQTDPDNYYLDIFKGDLIVSTAGSYQFSVDGDDAVELWIDGSRVVGFYGGHDLCRCNNNAATVNLTAGSHAIVFRHQEAVGGEGWRLSWKGPDSGNAWAVVPAARFSNLKQTFYNTTTAASTMTDYTVRTEVCKEISGVPATANYGREANCKAYTDGTTTIYKPTGLLHKYGDNNGMYFGLLTGSYDQNTDGGILRKPMSSITNEIETTTGIFKESGSTCGTASSSTCVAGIVGTINRLHITSFNYGDYSYSCGWITTRAMNPGECEMWGNPLAEMMYEAVRYFSGATSATPAFTTSRTRDDGVTLPAGGTGLPRFTTWTNPYTAAQIAPIPDTGPFPHCSKPFLMLISDVYPSFDSDKVPGVNSNFGSVAAATINNATLDASSRGQDLWNLEFGASANKDIFIGQVGSNFDGAPTAKTASSFGNIRGLAPSDPTRQGSYYAASVANFGLLNDLNPVTGNQKLGTFSIALAAPLPTIQIPIPGSPDKPVTIVPFAKSVGGSSISATKGAFQPTNQIVDFYVDVIKNTAVGNMDANVNGGRPYYLFRINYEDVEQGADHDMDAIALYEVKLNADNTVSVKVDSIYAAGGIIQHMGYVISGTTADGTYLVVRDSDTDYGSDPEYFLDRPNSSDTGANSAYHLPLRSSADTDVPDASNFATRTFTPNTTGTSATILNDPLWYAAKYGGFNDINGDGVPQVNEWDADGDKVPDNYFLVVNPLRLLRQLDDALGKIKDTSGTAAATTANSFTLQTDTQIFLGRFNSDGWSGELLAYPVTATSIGDPSWQAQIELTKKSPASRVILTYDPDKAAGSRGIPFQWSSMSSPGVLQNSLNMLSTGTVDGLGDKRVDFLRGVDVVGMRTRPQILLTNIASSSCVGSYSCPSGGGVAYCSTSGSVTCTPTGKANLLGDIINSQSQYVARPNGGFADASYAKFAADYSGANTTGKGNRQSMIYVGANDGMLHGFNATTGEELLAYVPSDVYRLRNSRWGLSKLTEADYGKTGSTNAHRYYVDATPTIGDICTEENVGSCSDGNWRSLLVGALGAGGQGIFALDVTDPTTFSEANASTLVKWEFSDKDDADMGYTIGRPYIVRLCTTRVSGSCDKWTWHVLINSGYNNTEIDGNVSTTGDAALFVLNAKTGALVRKINVKQGDMTATGPNALAEIAPVDLDGDGVVDYVYAGDIKGNLWRFDFTDQNPTNWDITLGTAGNPDPLYVAWDEQGTRARQPITTAPDAIRHPNGGVLLNFGTGSYLFKTDDLTTQAQTVYGIWDKMNTTSVASTDRLNLQEQQVITATVSATSTFAFGGVTKTETTDYRTLTDNSIDWAAKDGWYFNLPDTGERISNNVEVRGGTILRVVSTVPSDDICAAGGYSWEYFVDAFNGGRLTWSAYPDVSGLQNFGGTNAFASARKSTTGITPPGVIITNPKGADVEFDFGSAGQTIVKKDLGKGKAGRLGWREILTD
ncbi:MAG: PilC/PilY family type IV pilus protein [Candidatus Dechloromonas phosphoritropha]